MIGYVHTKLGFPSITGYRSFHEVTSDIDYWFEEYGVDGIFIDEVSNRWVQTAYDSV